MLVDALIPARAGSRRLPGKHWLELGGRPLLDWTLAPALACGLLRRVALSTDDAELRAHALARGASDFPLRPAELAADDTSSAEVVRHCLLWLRDHGPGLPDWLLLLQPTSPFRTEAHIRQALELAARHGRDVVSLGPLGKPIEWCRRLHGGLALAWEPPADPPAWRLNGALYLIRVARFLEDGRLLEESPLALCMEEWESVDIDTPFDLAVARAVAAGAGEGARA